MSILSDIRWVDEHRIFHFCVDNYFIFENKMFNFNY